MAWVERANLGGAGLEPAAGRLLVAAPLLADPSFVHTIVLLLDVDPADVEDGGVLGVVLNRPGDVAVGEVLGPWGEAASAPGVLFRGGPVGTDSVVAVARLRDATSSPPLGWRPMFGSTGLVDLDAPSEVVGPALSGLRVYAGYAGWSSGQLADEIAEGAWYVVDAEPHDAFAAEPERLWRQVLSRQQGDLAWLATYPLDPTQN